MRVFHKKGLSSLLRALCATAIVLLAIPSAYSPGGELCETPAFKRVGSNGAIGGTRHESGGGRSGLAAAPEGGVWVRIVSIRMNRSTSTGIPRRPCLSGDWQAVLTHRFPS